MTMIAVRAARQLPQLGQLTRPAPVAIAFRCYADQATARRSGSNATDALGSQRSPTSTPQRPPVQRKRASDSELSDIIDQMMPPRSSNPIFSRRPFQKRLDSAGDVAAQLDRMSSSPISQRQGQLLKGMNETRAVDLDVLDIGHRTTRLPPLNPPIRCDAYIGRAESVGRGVTVARAIEKLAIKLAINRVKSDSMRQRFHERKGLRRKRLRSERWRRRFKYGFVATVRKVRKMAKQGW